ncbi:DUF2205 domain protein [Rhodotorula toruloides]|uniref:BY PROTMAP: gi/472585553/gb/EMS23104.1/ DUF2205 domain protein [Rhodosporidium toruloides NP11] gi/647400764/emb/CDR46513.1/ RHTO0S12e05336g1_1 [Rhodosporidium toruloides] n=1 Tax=Rhodotorula toruloides TaxID=5286 RepID=A0A0K3CLV0_RHOTO|nr:DUF2205 domain protein [Rhodotorula toruloides]PRQ70649.1 putative coiled-coil protein (DUF2205)-domain containing protein [Rhodotorula toruloides]
MSRPHASSVDADNAWGPPPEAAQPEEAFSAADVQAKEQIILEIINKQDGLRALLQRIGEVQGEANKLKSENETLQTYIDNLTRTNAAAGASR